MTESQSQWQLRSGHYLGEISALCFLHLPPHLSSLPFLLAGTGSQLLVYDLVTSNVIKSLPVFQGVRVHGISLRNFSKHCSEAYYYDYKVAVFGEKRVKLFNLCVGAQKATSVINTIQLTLLHVLPRFSHWVLDVCFLKQGVPASDTEANTCLAIGCTDNSVCLWDICSSNLISQVTSPDRCLLYSMRMYGDKVDGLQIASGTIYNEIIIWRVSCLHRALGFGNSMNGSPIGGPQYEVVQICKLAGHEGSIFRITWSTNGLKLASVSDDRSTRVWTLCTKTEGLHNPKVYVVNHEISTILFGHSARVWDCCILDSLVITAGEDCTCRVWGPDGAQLKIIKEHIGRGVWRCLYDPNSSLLITAGFDSAIKVHQLPISLSLCPEICIGSMDLCDKKEVFNIHIPNSSGHVGLMDSKSEYVRCLHFSREDLLYVATNNGFLYYARLLDSGDVKWSEPLRVCEDAPVICMDLLSNGSGPSCGIEDWVALGDGKGNMMIVHIVGEAWSPELKVASSWSAELERQLLGTYWCKSLGYRFIFTADPRGSLKLWRLCDTSEFACLNSTSHCACLLAEFVSCFGMRIMCLDASFKEEVLVCGDIRGNLLVYPLSRVLKLATSGASDTKTYPLNYFKGAHGISSVCSVSIAGSCFGQLEIHSTGADGCICHLEYDRKLRILEFIGMKQVKELSTIHSVLSNADYCDELAYRKYAVGFASSDFMIWNLVAETKVVQITCGGWRRPHSYYLGDAPEMKNCFAFVKDKIIYIHRQWVQEQERNIYPQNLHLQFHGREIHSVCFICEASNLTANDKQGLRSESCWVATGGEDGTVRLTRYEPGIENWTGSKLLGEHVGGSAVRSICFVSKIHTIVLDPTCTCQTTYRKDRTGEGRDNPSLLISVGAKRVVTCWKQKTRMRNKRELALYNEQDSTDEIAFQGSSSSASFSSMSFQWLSTDMPTKSTNNEKRQMINHVDKMVNNVGASTKDATSGGSLPSDNRKLDLKSRPADRSENDWRYLAVTAFLVKVANSRISVCFIVVACSDATLTLRALVLPFQLWFDVALLAPLTSPILALQHIVIPKHLHYKESMQNGSLYIVVSGSTDGSIAFWDLTEPIENFTQRLSSLQMENYIDCQKRPQTGRGSHGGRWWRSLSGHVLKKKSIDDQEKGVHTSNENSDSSSASDKTPKRPSGNSLNGISEMSNPEYVANACSQVINKNSVSEEKVDDSSPDICEIRPLLFLNNVHQSGVNCLHVSNLGNVGVSDSGFQYSVISGGDDQAVTCLRFDLSLGPITHRPDNLNADSIFQHCQIQDYWMRLIALDKSISAHSSAVKGVWTDGVWVFSIGLDQRLRCWNLNERGKLIEHTHTVISVPEPESLDVRTCGSFWERITNGRFFYIWRQHLNFGSVAIHGVKSYQWVDIFGLNVCCYLFDVLDTQLSEAACPLGLFKVRTPLQLAEQRSSYL